MSDEAIRGEVRIVLDERARLEIHPVTDIEVQS